MKGFVGFDFKKLKPGDEFELLSLVLLRSLKK